MANTRERVKDFPSIVGTIQNDDYFPVDGATQGVRKAQVKDIMDAPITGLDTIANTTKGAINELATTAGKVWVGTQDEYDDLPDSKLTDNVLHCITDGEPSAYDSIWDKVGTDPLATTASDCSGAINELKQSLSQFDRKYLWSGNQYTTGTITLDEALSDGDEIIFTFRAFSASYVSQMRMLFLPNSLGYQYQFSFYGDSTQFARYRIKVKNDELNKLILEDVVNGASNCALIRIDRVVNR